MLQAVIRQKSGRWLKEINQEINTIGSTTKERIPREDEITSTVFGMLQYFDSREVYSFFCQLLHIPMKSTIEDITHQFSFWESKTHKSRQNSTQDKKTEPDVIVRFQINKTEQVTFILELKWGKNSHFLPDQLERQWENFQQGETHLVYLATHIHHDFFSKKAKYSIASWHDVTWQQFLGFAQSESNQTQSYSQGCRLFLEDLSLFLRKLNLRQFSKFSHLNIPLNYLSSYQLMTLNNISVPFLDLQWSIYE